MMKEYETRMYLKYGLQRIGHYLYWSGIAILAFYMFPVSFFLMMFGIIGFLDPKYGESNYSIYESPAAPVVMPMFTVFVLLWIVAIFAMIFNYLKDEVPKFFAHNRTIIERKVEEEMSKLKCDDCESPIGKSDKFCSECGNTLKKEKELKNYE